MYYKYFFDFLSAPTKTISPLQYSIFDPRVLLQARENGDLRIPEKVKGRSTPGCNSLVECEDKESGLNVDNPSRKRRQEEEEAGKKKLRTNITTTVLESNVVELEDSDEDDIQILEQRLLAEGGRRRVYYQPRSSPTEEITLQSRYGYR